MDNQISEIKGLENLKNLKELDLKRNPIPENLLIRLGAFYNDLGLLTIPDPQKIYRLLSTNAGNYPENKKIA